MYSITRAYDSAGEYYSSCIGEGVSLYEALVIVLKETENTYGKPSLEEREWGYLVTMTADSYTHSWSIIRD